MHLVCVKYITFYVDESYIRIRNSEWETFNVAKSLLDLLTLYHHRDGFVQSIITVKPYSETGFSFNKSKRPSVLILLQESFAIKFTPIGFNAIELRHVRRPTVL